MPIRACAVTPLFEVYDLRRSVAFYVDVLGAEVVARAGETWWAMLKLGDAVFMLNGRYEDDKQPPQPDARRLVGHEDAELYFAVVDVDAAYEHVRGKGVDVKPPEMTGYGMRRLYLRDPDNFKLCFQQRAD